MNKQEAIEKIKRKTEYFEWAWQWAKPVEGE